METSTHKSKSRKNKNRKNRKHLNMKNNHDLSTSFNADTSPTNGSRNNDTSDNVNACCEYNTDVNIISCKPCSVILERLSEEDVDNLLSGNALGVKKLEENIQPYDLPRSCDSDISMKEGNQNIKELYCDRSSIETIRKRSNSFVVQSTCSKEQKMSSDNLNMNQVYEQDPCGIEILQIYDSNENHGEGTSSGDRISNLIPSKRARLSLKKNKIADAKGNDVCNQHSRTEILPNENLEGVENAENSYETPERTLSLLKRLSLMFQKNLAQRKKEEPLKCDSSDDFNKTEISEACRQDSPSEIVQTSETSAPHLYHRERLIKRKLIDTEEEVSKLRKSKRSKEQEGSRKRISNTLGKPDSLSLESSLPRLRDRKNTLQGSQFRSNEIDKPKIGLRVKNKSPIINDSKIPLVKLERITSPSKSKIISNIRTTDHVDIDCKTKISHEIPKNVGCSRVTKNRKITDYFFKIDKSSIVSTNSSNKLVQREKDLILKKKYGINKDPIVLLIDLKNLKIPGSKYLAPEIGELTQEYSNSFANINFTNNLTANTIPSSSISLHNKFSVHDYVDKSYSPKPTHVVLSVKNPLCRNPESLLSMNHSETHNPIEHKVLPIEYVNTSSIPDRIDKLTCDPLQIEATPSFQNISSVCYDSPSVRKYSPVKNPQNSSNNNSFINNSTLKSTNNEQLSNSMEHSKDNYIVNVDLDVDQEIVDKDSSCEHSHAQRLKLQSSFANINNLGNNSSDSQSNKFMEKSPKSINTHVRKLVLSPEKCTVTINNKIESNKLTQLYVTDMNGKLSKTGEVQENHNSMTFEDTSEVGSGSNELRNEAEFTLVDNRILNISVDQPDTHLTLTSVTQSPTIVGNSRMPSKHGIPRHLPVNSMTILSREMIEEQNFWNNADNIFGNEAEDNARTEKRGSVNENESTDILSSDNTQKNKIITSCSPKKNLDSKCTENKNPVNVTENFHGTNLNTDRRLCIESENENLSLRKSLASSNTDNIPSKSSVSSKNETCSREANALTHNVVQTKIDNMQISNSVSGMEISTLNIPSSKQVSSVEDSIDPISNQCTNQNVNNVDSRGEPMTDSLVIEMEEMDSESPQIEDRLLRTTGSSCSSSGLDAVVEGKKTSRQTEAPSNYECVFCRKLYKKANNLEIHLRTHVKLAIGYCIICDKPVNEQNAIKHYLEHCGQSNPYTCEICKKTFLRREGLSIHVKLKHNTGKNRSRIKLNPTVTNRNKCTVCQLACNSEEELFSHLYKHTPQELQAAFNAALAKQKQQLYTPNNSQTQNSSAPGKKQPGDEKQLSSESTTTTTDPLPTPPAEIPNYKMSVCKCHKNERLEISGGIIIEIAFPCGQCKTFFKSRKCFKNHNGTSSKCSDVTSATPKMFCNQCCVVLNSLLDVQEHLTKHGEGDDQREVSILCKHCNIFFFGIGPLFHAHWNEHLKNTLFVADHHSFSNNMKVKIVEPECSDSVENDEPTESLFLADYQCKNCEKPFRTEVELHKHINSSKCCSEQDHSTTDAIENPISTFKLICSLCNKGFIDKLTFDSHMDTHEIVKTFLEASIYTDTVLCDNQYKCIICNTAYDTMQNYKAHFIKHEVIRQKFDCARCNRTMLSLEDFERHAIEHKDTPGNPVVCRVIFAMAKFYCKSCKLWFDTKSTLDEHLKTHSDVLLTDSESTNNTTVTIEPAAEKKIYNCKICQQEFDDEVKLNAHVLTHNTDTSDLSTPDPILIHLSDDSNSTDVELITTTQNEKSQEPVAGNSLIQKEQKTANTPKNKKPSFLRVKNLKELLPYACSKCKAEFDTRINLSKHVCIPHSQAVQNKEFNYFCKICKSFPCNNDADWNLHMLSHLPLQSSQNFQDSWYSVLNMPSGHLVFKCNICKSYECLTIHAMRRHFLVSHPDIYHPIFKCRVCWTFTTEIEHEIRRHEIAHFQKPPSIQQSHNTVNTSTSARPQENFNYGGNSVTIPSSSNLIHNTSSLQPQNTFREFQQLNSIPPLNNSNNNLPLSSSSFPPVTNPIGFQQTVPNQSNSGNNSLILQNFDFNKFPQSIPIQPTTSAGQSLPMVQPVPGPANFQQPASIPAVTSSENNLSWVKPVQNFNNTQQLGFQQSISRPSVTNSGNTLSSLQSVENPQWLSTTGSTVQIQISNGPSITDMSNMINALPMYVTNVMYYCRICKNYKCSTQQELKAHEALHEFIQSDESPKRLYRCNVCENIFCPSEEHLKEHMNMYHKANKPESHIKCKQCNQTFASPTQLSQHGCANHLFINQEPNDTHPRISYPYTCNICSIGFLEESYLQAHMRQIHSCAKSSCQNENKTKSLYKCDTCGLLLISEATLSYHRKSHNLVCQ